MILGGMDMKIHYLPLLMQLYLIYFKKRTLHLYQLIYQPKNDRIECSQLYLAPRYFNLTSFSAANNLY